MPVRWPDDEIKAKGSRQGLVILKECENMYNRHMNGNNSCPVDIPVVSALIHLAIQSREREREREREIHYVHSDADM